MNWADWTILAIIAISALISIKRGFVKEALSLLSWVLAIAIAFLFGEKLATLLQDSITTPSLRMTVAMGILFAATLVVGAMVNYLIAEVVRMTGLAGTDRFFGLFFGMARGVIVVMALLIFIPQTMKQDPWWRQSQVIPHFMKMEAWSRKVAKETTGLMSNLVAKQK